MSDTVPELPLRDVIPISSAVREKLLVEMAFQECGEVARIYDCYFEDYALPHEWNVEIEGSDAGGWQIVLTAAREGVMRVLRMAVQWDVDVMSGRR